MVDDEQEIAESAVEVYLHNEGYTVQVKVRQCKRCS